MPKKSRDLALGAFASLALLVLAIGIMAVGGDQGLFSGQAAYRVVFPDTQGLIVGSPVHMAGVQIGSVSEIRLPTDPRATGIEVVITLDDAYRNRVREGSHAALRFLAWLSGEKYVEVASGDPSAPVLAEGSVIPVAGQSEIFQQGEDIAENMNEITASLVEILEPMRNGEGLLGKMVTDPEFGEVSLSHLQATLANLEALSAQVRAGRGLAGRLLSDQDLAASADKFAVAVDDLAQVTATLRRQEGALGELIREGAEGQQAIQDVRASAASLKATMDRLERGEGFAGKLLNDDAYGEQNAERLAQTLGHLEEILAKVERGEGTLGLLVNDTRLYDSANQVIGGVNDSKFAQWLLRRYRKRGIEVEERQDQSPPVEPPPSAPSPPPQP